MIIVDEEPHLKLIKERIRELEHLLKIARTTHDLIEAREGREPSLGKMDKGTQAGPAFRVPMPDELVTHILSYIPTRELKEITRVSSQYHRVR